MSVTDESPASAGSNVAEYSVSELSGALKRTVEDTFGHVRVRGEISGYRGAHGSGHAYFALKDERSRLEAVIWRTAFAKLAFKPEEGLEVIATGKLTTYPGSSKYQIVIEELRPAGAGALMALLNERRLKLEAEGLFAGTRKRRPPFLPRVVGIVTSPTGAVIRDICHRVADRFPVHLLLWPVRVQGETSAAEVAAAIAGFNEIELGGPIPRPDLLIVARGGGSLEDLWGFNDEAVVRAAAASQIPLISAVGHETDWTLIDLAADVRAPTPTAAAELAVPVRAEIAAALAALAARHGTAVSRNIQGERRALASLVRALPSADALLAFPRRQLDEAAAGLGRSLRVALAERRRLYAEAASALSPVHLEALVRDKRGSLLHLDTRARHSASVGFARRRQRLAEVAALLRPQIVSRQRDAARFRLTTAAERLDRALVTALGARRIGLDQATRLAASLDPRQVLERGYVILRDEDDRPITRPADLSPGTPFAIEFAGGERRQALATSAGTTRKPKRTREFGTTQGDLF